MSLNYHSFREPERTACLGLISQFIWSLNIKVISISPQVIGDSTECFANIFRRLLSWNMLVDPGFKELVCTVDMKLYMTSHLANTKWFSTVIAYSQTKRFVRIKPMIKLRWEDLENWLINRHSEESYCKWSVSNVPRCMETHYFHTSERSPWWNIHFIKTFFKKINWVKGCIRCPMQTTSSKIIVRRHTCASQQLTNQW